MARVVREIMNPELFTVREDTPPEDALEAILDLGITAVPVVDESRRPIGVTSLRDLIEDRTNAIRRPAIAISGDSSVEHAARLMAETRLHHLVVVGSDGRVTGMVSSIDLLRATIGLPAAYPATFPHHDEEPGVHWTDRAPLDDAHVDAAPDGEGVVVLSTGGTGRSEREVFVEATPALRARVRELAHPPSDTPAPLAELLGRRDLRFRCAIARDEAARRRVERRLRARIQGTPPPHEDVEAGPVPPRPDVDSDYA